VSELLGRPQSWLSKCESGERRLDVIELAQLAAIYDVPLVFLIPEEVGVRASRARSATTAAQEVKDVHI
jgi:transcriptional regulator with XRE-family HTH domain